MRFLKQTVLGVMTLAAFSLADNPISSYHYLADPSAASDGDTFYILTDVDDFSPDKDFSYDLVGLYAFSSKDMKNWTDHGMIFQAGREFNYVGNTWASGIAVKNGKFYIVYPDGATSIGMITSNDIAGPYIDPIAVATNGQINKLTAVAADWAPKSLIPGCDGIAHCFDPGIFFDKDGSGYVIFGGGENSSRQTGNNFDIVKLIENGDGITVDEKSLTRIQAPKSFEAPYIHKRNNKYYLSFNNTNQVIDYGVSDKITGPYTYVGEVIPAIWQVPDTGNKGGNNHQGFAEFKGKWYAVYHDRRLVSAAEHPRSCTRDNVCDDDPNPENHRSVAIDELTWNGDNMNSLTFTREGPKQIQNFDPYQKYKALTSSKQRNVRSRTDWVRNKPVTHILLPMTGANKESWIRVSGVDFKNGAASFTVTAGANASGNKVEVRTGSVTGTLAGTCDIKNTGAKNVYAENKCNMSATALKGVVNELFLVFKGNADSTMGITYWEFSPKSSSDVPSSSSVANSSSSVVSSSSVSKPVESSSSQAIVLRKPFGGLVPNVPGKIEAENFDEPGEGVANQTYLDKSEGNSACAENSGAVCSKHRENTDVDLKEAASGVAIGWFQTGEWLEYTINVPKAGDYTLYVAASSGTEGGGALKFYLNDKGTLKELTDDIIVESAGEENFSEYAKTKAANVTLPAGEIVIRMECTKEWVDVDYFNFASGKNASDNALIGEDVTPEYTPDESSSSSAAADEKSSSSGKTDAIALHYMVGAMSDTYNVYDMQGILLGKIKLNGVSAPQALKQAGFRAGRYILSNRYNRLMVNSIR